MGRRSLSLTAKPVVSPTFRRPHRPSSVIRTVGTAIVLVICFYYLQGTSRNSYLRTYRFAQSPGGPRKIRGQTWRYDEEKGLGQRPSQQPLLRGTEQPATLPSRGEGKADHPIDRLMRDADARFDTMLSHESRSIGEAAARYRERRGRHPPPGFDVWYDYARANHAVVVEEFWDQIYHDLEPYWALDPRQIRKEARNYEIAINVRNGSASSSSDWFWTLIWVNMLQHIEQLLPDMDIPLNAMDEPRIVTPWEQMNEYMAEAAKTRKLFDPKVAVKTFESLPVDDHKPDRTAMAEAKQWERSGSYWDIARRGCHPDSPARKTPSLSSFDHQPDIESINAAPHMYRGFVSNTTLATSPCHQPDLRGLHGSFIEPLSLASTKTLFPLFGGSKLGINNEILMPPPMYWSRDDRFETGQGSAADTPWNTKDSRAFWRGVATGGQSRENNWRGFQRHRFVAMNNATQLRFAEDDKRKKTAAGKQNFDSSSRGHSSQTLRPEPWAGNFAAPDEGYGLAAQADGWLGEWTAGWSDTAFTDLNCRPEAEPHNQCHYTSPYFAIADGVALDAMFSHKYLPDVDGNSFSGRYLSFLRSTSLPVKATMFREWHDSRLVAWRHFVPMDPRMGDWHAIMEYFVGYAGQQDGEGGRQAFGHDAQAEKMAMAGREWAARVLRREDMLVYVLRLLLEYARISDERRERMGFVEDLL
ncbi:hypothetical protein MAPG_09398 [Magnaporthiopsis poae ATCC 64411]|uniref:Glycosyl transferase CAP10 domain-containing protein n=1 Tax=Magnaporthiopsis poae (strain ATCC 64411 / 73-15) TaxID=644358 RepID=A0A0C4E9U8_MAGP6|nr:hypothetical protein MAPG_09398 [Magnaporthiopsis poae ATCC 64411]